MDIHLPVWILIYHVDIHVVLTKLLNILLPSSAQESLQSIISNSRNLRTLALGCIQDLTDQADIFLPLLAHHQPSSISTLSLASIKYDPNSYALLDVTPDNFTAFTNLQVGVVFMLKYFLPLSCMRIPCAD